MLNNVVFIGKLLEEPTQLENGIIIKVAVERAFKNEDGEYKTDIIPVNLWNGIATNIKDCCIKGDIIGVKGRLMSENNNVIVVGERITFLSAKKEKAE